MNNNVTVVILAAGLGTRMKSSRAKVLHQAGGDTLLNHVIRAALAVATPEQMVVVVGHQAAEVRRSVAVPGIRFATQAEQKGTGHAVACATEQIPSKEGQLLILNGDGPLLRRETLSALVHQASQNGFAGNLVTTEVADPHGYGRIVRAGDGLISAIVEQKAATAEQQSIREINPGVYAFDAPLFWRHLSEVQPNNAAREYYLTDMIEILRGHGGQIAPLLVEDESELLGINTRVELAVADRILRTRKVEQLMLSGVTVERPETVTVDVNVEVGLDSFLESGVQLRGATQVGERCHVGAGSILRNCHIAPDVTIHPYVLAEDSTIAARSAVGPFARLRMNAEAGEDTRIGNFVELKKTHLGAGSKAQHLAYLGDATIGDGVNIGAGTITCNFDGAQKHPTKIANNVFVGSNSTLVAPIELAEGAYVAAGSVITKNVEADSLAIGRALQVTKEGWAKRRREQAKRDK